MAAESVLAKLALEIGIPIDELKRNLQIASNEVKKESLAMQTEFDKIRSSVLNIKNALLAVFVGSQMASFVKDVAMTAARTEVLDVVVKQVGRTAGWSAKEIDGYVTSITKMGITTQAARSIVTKFVQQNLDLAQSAKLARVAQDAAVIGGTDSSAALMGLVHGITTQQTEVLRTYGIVINIEQEMKKFASTVGKSSEALTAMEKQQVVLNAVLTSGEKIAGTYEKSMTAVGKLMTSIPRYIEEAKNILGDEFLPLLTEITEAQKDWLTTSAGIEKLRSFFQDLAGGLHSLFKIVKSGIDFVISNSGWIKDFIVLFTIIKTGIALYGILLPLIKSKIFLMLTDAAATKAAGGAMAMFNKTLMANPLGLVIGLLTAAISALYVFKAVSEKSTDSYVSSINDMIDSTKAHIKQQKSLEEYSKEYLNLAKVVNKTGLEELRMAEVEAIIHNQRPDLFASSDTLVTKIEAIGLVAVESAEKIKDFADMVNQLELIKVSIDKEKASAAIDDLNKKIEKIGGRAKPVSSFINVDFIKKDLNLVEELFIATGTRIVRQYNQDYAVDIPVSDSSIVNIGLVEKALISLTTVEEGRSRLIKDQASIASLKESLEARNLVLARDNTKEAKNEVLANTDKIKQLKELGSIYLSLNEFAYAYGEQQKIRAEAEVKLTQTSKAALDESKLTEEERKAQRARDLADAEKKNTLLFDSLKKLKKDEWDLDQLDGEVKLKYLQEKYNNQKVSTDKERSDKLKTYMEIVNLNKKIREEEKKSQLELAEIQRDKGGYEALLSYYKGRYLLIQGWSAKEVVERLELLGKIKDIETKAFSTKVSILELEIRAETKTLADLKKLYEDRLATLKGDTEEEILIRLELLQKIKDINKRTEKETPKLLWDSAAFRAKVDGDVKFIEEKLRAQTEAFKKMKRDEGEAEDAYNARKQVAENDLNETRKTHYAETHKFQIGLLHTMEAGYGAFVSNLLNKDMTLAEKRKAIGDTMKQAFVQLLADMLKEKIKVVLAEMAIHITAEKSKTAATTTGTATRSALNLKEAATSILGAVASGFKWLVEKLGPFGLAAGIVLGAGIIAGFGAVKKKVGFEKGGVLPKGKMGFFEGLEKEIVAPEKDFKQVFKSYSDELIAKYSQPLPQPTLAQPASHLIKMEVSLKDSFIAVNDKASVDAFYNNIILPAVSRYNKKLGK